MRLPTLSADFCQTRVSLAGGLLFRGHRLPVGFDESAFTAEPSGLPNSCNCCALAKSVVPGGVDGGEAIKNIRNRPCLCEMLADGYSAFSLSTTAGGGAAIAECCAFASAKASLLAASSAVSGPLLRFN